MAAFTEPIDGIEYRYYGWGLGAVRHLLGFLPGDGQHNCYTPSCPCFETACGCSRPLPVDDVAPGFRWEHMTWHPSDPIVRFTSQGLEVRTLTGSAPKD